MRGSAESGLAGSLLGRLQCLQGVKCVEQPVLLLYNALNLGTLAEWRLVRKVRAAAVFVGLLFLSRRSQGPAHALLGAYLPKVGEELGLERARHDRGGGLGDVSA